LYSRRIACRHIKHGGIGRQHSIEPPRGRGAFGGARRREHHAAREPALRERYAELGRGGERRRHARDDFDRDIGFAKRRDLLLRASEERWIAALEANYDAMPARRVHEALVDEALRGGVPAAALADQDLFRARRKREGVRMDERIVEDNVRVAQDAGRAQREEVRRARAGADQVNGPLHLTRPAATVWFVASSMRIIEPVARTWS